MSADVVVYAFEDLATKRSLHLINVSGDKRGALDSQLFQLHLQTLRRLVVSYAAYSRFECHCPHSDIEAFIVGLAQRRDLFDRMRLLRCNPQ